MVIQGNHVYDFLYQHCEGYRVEWTQQKILARIGFRNQGVLSVLINAWIPRNLLQRILNDEYIKALEDEHEIPPGLFLKPWQALVGRDVDPYIVKRYEEFRQTLGAFLSFIIS